MISRRRFLGAVIATVAAPAIVRASSLMPVRHRQWIGVDPALGPDLTAVGRWAPLENRRGKSWLGGYVVIVHPDEGEEWMRALNGNVELVKMRRVPLISGEMGRILS